MISNTGPFTTSKEFITIVNRTKTKKEPMIDLTSNETSINKKSRHDTVTTQNVLKFSLTIQDGNDIGKIILVGDSDMDVVKSVGRSPSCDIVYDDDYISEQ